MSANASVQPTDGWRAFRLESRSGDREVRVDRQFRSCDSVTLNANAPVDGFAITGTVTQVHPGSFVRVLMEDSEGKEYLVMESCRMYNDVDTMLLQDYCEETMVLDGVVPSKLKVFVINATIDISKVTLRQSQGRVAVQPQSAQATALLRNEQCRSVAERINAYNRAHNKLWRAAPTEVSMMPWESKKRVLGIDGDCFTYGFEYYYSGIIDIGDISEEAGLESTPRTASPYIDHFDWRNRHGINWMTPVRDQSTGGGCWAFAAIGVTEALVNLYYNQKLDYDLSEQEVISCTEKKYYGSDTTAYNTNAHGGQPYYALDHIIEYGVSEETAFPFSNSDEPCINKGSFDELVSLVSRHMVLNHNAHNRDSVKKALIKYGPLTGSVRYRKGNTVPIQHKGHSMTLVGYGIIHEGDTIRVYDYNETPQTDTIHANDPRIGMTFWIFKNSYGLNNNHQGYVYAFFNNDSSFESPYYAKTPVSSLLLTDADIAVTDTDGDGYFTWGIGPKPAHCPAWVPDLPDGDDSDYAAGPMDEFGYNYDLSAHVSDVVTIPSDTTWSQKRYIYNNIVVPTGVTLTITNDVVFYNGAKITLTGGTLHVNGGNLYRADISIQPNSGSNVLITANGSIRDAAGKSFTVPKGTSMKMTRGTIK